MPVEFVDVATGRSVDPSVVASLLRGINFCSEPGREGCKAGLAAREFFPSRGRAMNRARLDIFWDGPRPVPWRFGDACLDRVAQRAQWAAQRLRAMLDMHHDLSSAWFSEGAPPSAALENGNPHPPNPDME